MHNYVGSYVRAKKKLKLQSIDLNKQVVFSYSNQYSSESKKKELGWTSFHCVIRLQAYICLLRSRSLLITGAGTEDKVVG